MALKHGVNANLLRKWVVAYQLAPDVPAVPDAAQVAAFVPVRLGRSGLDRTGIGLGLTIARQSVSANGGTLLVRDIPGHGCVFAISLPRNKLPT